MPTPGVKETEPRGRKPYEVGVGGLFCDLHSGSGAGALGVPESAPPEAARRIGGDIPGKEPCKVHALCEPQPRLAAWALGRMAVLLVAAQNVPVAVGMRKVAPTHPSQGKHKGSDLNLAKGGKEDIYPGSRGTVTQPRPLSHIGLGLRTLPLSQGLAWLGFFFFKSFQDFVFLEQL